MPPIRIAPRRYLAPVAWLFVVCPGTCGGQQFPAPRVGVPASMEAPWLRAPIVAIGEVTNVSSYGEQTVDRLPPPTSPEAHHLFWCIGDFHSVAVVKGTLHKPIKRYLWATTIPGCHLWPEDPAFVAYRFKALAWYLREEGGFLRPPFDYGAWPFLGLFVAWEPSSTLSPQRQLGTLLLTLEAVSEDAGRYVEDMLSNADIACELLGKTQCAQRIRELSTENSALHEPLCQFLRSELGQECEVTR